jgi:hypothetical protein
MAGLMGESISAGVDEPRQKSHPVRNPGAQKKFLVPASTARSSRPGKQLYWHGDDSYPIQRQLTGGPRMIHL